MAELSTEKHARAASAVRRHAKRDSKQKGRLQSLVASEALREQQVSKGTRAMCLSECVTLLQMRAREEREAKRSRMDGRHEFILSTVADNLGMSVEEAEEFMLEGTQVLSSDEPLTHIMTSLFSAVG